MNFTMITYYITRNSVAFIRISPYFQSLAQFFGVFGILSLIIIRTSPLTADMVELHLLIKSLMMHIS